MKAVEALNAFVGDLEPEAHARFLVSADWDWYDICGRFNGVYVRGRSLSHKELVSLEMNRPALFQRVADDVKSLKWSSKLKHGLVVGVAGKPRLFGRR